MKSGERGSLLVSLHLIAVIDTGIMFIQTCTSCSYLLLLFSSSIVVILDKVILYKIFGYD